MEEKPQQSEVDSSEPETIDLTEPEHHEPHKSKSEESRLDAWRGWYMEHKKWTIPVSVLIVLILLAAIPWSRYHTAGLVLKKDVTIKVTDASADVPVSGAKVSIGDVSAITGGTGQATLHQVSVGNHQAVITKKYYQDKSISLLVPILKQKNIPLIQFTATGRQASITVVDLVSGKPISNASINIAGSKAATDKSGQTIVVVPAGSTGEKAAISADGYNDANVTVQVSGSEIKDNIFKLTPAGKVYFLSKLSGKIDLVKTNLDGTARETVLAGTGKEDASDTVLLASRDWKYLALLSSRDGSLAKLYVINTTDEKLLTMDEGNASFTPVGWAGHRFIYTVSRNGYNNWQSNAFSIKSYNAENGQILTLANSNATGSSNADAQYEGIFNTLIMGNDVIYSRTWYSYPGYINVDGKQNVLSAIHPDGSASRVLKSVDSKAAYIGSVRLNKPHELYFSVTNTDYSHTDYFVLDKAGNVSQSQTISDKSFFDETNTYLASPSGDQTFWSEPRDGKNSLFLGDADGNNAKQVATLSDYEVYGWYSNNYLLVSKSGSQLYILPTTGIKDDTAAIKITDYHKPAQSFYGYGGGYGGL